MRVQSDSEVSDYVKFIAQFYPVQDLKLRIVELGEKEWRQLGTAIMKGRAIIEEMVNEDLIEGTTSEVWESHESYKEASLNDSNGYYIPSSNLLAIINLWKKNEASQSFQNLLEGTDFFIMLRIVLLKDRLSYLDALFHEILHTIETKTQKRIYRGSTIEQEARDTQEIVMPYVREFIRYPKTL